MASSCHSVQYLYTSGSDVSRYIYAVYRAWVSAMCRPTLDDFMQMAGGRGRVYTHELLGGEWLVAGDGGAVQRPRQAPDDCFYQS